ncbi:hypothetical protein CTAYLR_008642 [Chrysophaeum taylorii]|uniref:Ribosomal protein S21 n=1 Tax=Chrysophaeum taylorii TaxID=2483200 RepID=A0AAD7U814_9STRA|nr:hypothetical protein CTAYLR_008642 [Chrysophaeum taylorii]
MRLLVILGLLAGAAAFVPQSARPALIAATQRRAAVRQGPAMTIKISLRPNESVDSAIMRLRREVNKSGHLRVLKVISRLAQLISSQTKRFFENPREKKKRKLVESRMKMKFARAMQKRRNNNRQMQ